MLPIPGMEAHRERDKGRDIFARLYEVHAPSLLSFVGLRVATREDARDLLVEVFLAALENKQFIQLDEAQQRSWLWKVTRNKVTDYYRKHQHQHISSLEEYTGDLYTDESDEPEVMAILSDEASRLRGFIREHLTPFEQQLISLRFAHNLRSPEIARIVGKKEGAIRTQLSRTLNLLRSLYGRPDHNDHF